LTLFAVSGNVDLEGPLHAEIAAYSILAGWSQANGFPVSGGIPSIHRLGLYISVEKANSD